MTEVLLSHIRDPKCKKDGEKEGQKELGWDGRGDVGDWIMDGVSRGEEQIGKRIEGIYSQF